MELSHVWRAIVRYWLVCLLTIVSVVGVTAYLAFSPANRYDATATLLVEPTDTSVANSVSTVTFLLPALQVQLSSEVVAHQAAMRVRPGLQGVSVDLSSSVEPGTGLLRVTTESDNAAAVAPWANAYAQALIGLYRAKQALKISTIDPAVPPHSPSGPQRASVLVSGVVLALILAIVAALIAEAIGRRRRISSEIARRFQVPVLGEIPGLRRKLRLRGASDLLTSGDEVVVEKVMGLRANLEVPLARGASSLCVTSPQGGEGTSTIVTTLAWALARAGREVTAVEANLRSPALRYAAIPHDARVKRTDLGVIVNSATHPKISLVDASDLRAVAEQVLVTPSEALHPAEVVAVALPHVLRASERPGAVAVIDTPALVYAADAAVVAGVASATLIVLDARRRGALTRLEQALVRLDEAGGSVVGVVLNWARRNQTDSGAEALPVAWTPAGVPRSRRHAGRRAAGRGVAGRGMNSRGDGTGGGDSRDEDSRGEAERALRSSELW